MKKKIAAIGSIVAIVGITATILIVSNNRKEDEE